MKKILSFLFCLSLLVSVTAQERTVPLAGTNKLWDLSQTKTLTYVGNTSDRLIPTTRDTIDYYVELRNWSGDPQNIYIRMTFDTIAGADTTIAITIQQKKMNGEDYTDLIASAVTSAISAEASVVKTTLGVTTQYTNTQAAATDYLRQDVDTDSDTLTVAARTITGINNTVLFYRFLKIRMILQGNDSVGTGIIVKKIELIMFD